MRNIHPCDHCDGKAEFEYYDFELDTVLELCLECRKKMRENNPYQEEEE